jgi:hypothetical protein
MVLDIVHGKQLMKEYKIMPNFVLDQTLGRNEAEMRADEMSQQGTSKRLLRTGRPVL